MARPATGKELKFHPMKLDDDVWAAIQALKKNHPTINAGLRLKLGIENARAKRTNLDAVAPAAGARVGKASIESATMAVNQRGTKLKIGVSRNVKRTIPPKGDKTR